MGDCACYRKTCFTFFYIMFISSMAFTMVFVILVIKSFNEYNEIYKNWEKIPAYSISIKNYNKNELNVEKMDKKYNYKNLLKKNIEDKNFLPCGTDKTNNFLYFPKDIECPINDIEYTDSPFPSKKFFHYKTIQLYPSGYLHYSNENIRGNILIDINISYYNSYEIKNINFFYYNGEFIDDIKDGKRNLSKFIKMYIFKNSIKSIDILIIINFSLLFIFSIIDVNSLCKNDEICFEIHYIIILLFHIQIILFIIMNFYFKIDDTKEENFNVLTFIPFIQFLYAYLFYLLGSISIEHKHEINYYYFLVYFFRYILCLPFLYCHKKS